MHGTAKNYASSSPPSCYILDKFLWWRSRRLFAAADIFKLMCRNFCILVSVDPHAWSLQAACNNYLVDMAPNCLLRGVICYYFKGIIRDGLKSIVRNGTCRLSAIEEVLCTESLRRNGQSFKNCLLHCGCLLLRAVCICPLSAWCSTVF